MTVLAGRRRNAPAHHLGAFKFLAIGRTHVGCVRAINEDAFLNRPDAGVWAVADGMGGHDGGAVASMRVIEALGGVGACASAYDLREGAARALQRANEELAARGSKEFSGPIGSTVAALLAFGGHYACLWAGDSRVYLYRSGILRLLTRDHSLVQEMVEAGVMDADQARFHPQANVITRAIGANATLDLETVYGTIREGDRFLLCSDGLYSALGDREIAEEMKRTPIERAADKLIGRALSRGVNDNVTLVIVMAAEA